MGVYESCIEAEKESFVNYKTNFKFNVSVQHIGNFTFLLLTTVSAAKSGKCGTNLTWTLDDEGTLIISGHGKMQDLLLSF